ncbi:TonB-dependent receptor plug domain-containing protein [Chitinasiproducens palmae]|uniref:Vitamin B12 transporter n=1 Tax=Chitinasiproducens palmae TaxID=1770053 RepID=A0A1H2PN10_9BURK|nr:TonB-dependent receptor [Chitinasiproducens palmae]SDV48007.1 vitamin B12 transporter [Chitinasiproducens palmae]
MSVSRLAAAAFVAGLPFFASAQAVAADAVASDAIGSGAAPAASVPSPAGAGADAVADSAAASAASAASAVSSAAPTAAPSAASAGAATTASAGSKRSGAMVTDEAAPEPVQVTAARVAQPLATALPATSVFDRQAIDDAGAADLPTLLQLAPGVQISQNGGPGSTASLSIRGSSPNQTLVLIDGVRLESASTGAASISQLLTAPLERVEVVDGNMSALYGAGAVGGVVQLFTREGGPWAPRGHASVSYGRYGTQTQTAGVDGALDADGATTFALNATRFRTNGFSAQDVDRPPPGSMPNPNDNAYRNTTVSGTVKHRFNADWEAGVRFLQSDGRLSYDGYTPAETNESVMQTRLLSLFANGRLTDRWRTQFTLAETTDHATDYTDGVFASQFDTRNRQLAWRNTFDLAPTQTLQFGYERLAQRLRAASAYFDGGVLDTPHRRVDAGYVAYDGRFGAHQFQANVRRDQYSDFGGANSYYLGYGFDLTPHWRVNASYASAFRAPTYNDLYYPGYSNPDLQPERAHTVEAGLQYSEAGFGVARVTAFETRYRNLIAAQNYSVFNVATAKVQGIETAWQGQIGRAELRASFTIQNPVDESNNRELARRARRFASFAAAMPYGSWRVGGNVVASGERAGSAYGPSTPGYATVNLNAKYQITRTWSLAVRLDNVFNRDYQTVYGYDAPGRAASVTLAWQQ